MTTQASRLSGETPASLQCLFPEEITYIGNYAFYDCTGIEALDFSKCTELTNMGMYAFYNCTGIEVLDLSECTALETIGAGVFYRCSGLKEISLPSSLTSIGNSAFRDCSSLETMTVHASTPPVLNNYAFNNVPTNIPVYVPDVTAYERDNDWKEFFSNFVLLESEQDQEQDQEQGPTTGEEGEGEENQDPTTGEGEGENQDPTGLNTATLASKVSVRGLEVELSVEADTQVNVYAISGQLVVKTTASRFTLPSAGVYIISAGGETTKVVARP